MKRILGNNPHLKVLAFTLTIVLYFFVVAEKETSRDFTVALTVGAVPAEYVVLNALPDVVVTLRGGARAFARIDQDALRNLTIDITDPDTDRREIREADLELPGHFTIVSIAPRWVAVDMERMVTRELPIRAVVRGTPARGFEANDPVATPSRLTVSAPESYFPEFDSVFTESIDINGADAPVQRTVAPSIQRPYVSYPLDTTISVRVEIATVVETRTIEGVPIMITGPTAQRCSLDAASLSVIVTGPKSLIDALDAHDLFAGVDCLEFSDLGPGIYLPDPAIKNLAAGIEVVEVIPSTLRLTVEPEPEPEVQVLPAPQNAPQGTGPNPGQTPNPANPNNRLPVPAPGE